MRSDDIRAVLIADCGIQYTRVSLVDVVEEDQYRLIAQREMPTTAEPPFSNVTLAVREGIAELERSTGRQLLENDHLRIPQGRDGQGVDAFVATCSAAGALPVLILAVTADITARNAVQAAEGTYAVPFRIVTMEEVLRDNPLKEEYAEAPGERWWKVLERLGPGVVLLVGGVDWGKVAPLRKLARSLMEALPPRPARIEQQVARLPVTVLYAGNAQAQEVVKEELVDHVDLHIVDNLTPALRQTNLLPARRELERLYEEQVLQQQPGYRDLKDWVQGPVQLPYVGLQLSARFLAGHNERQVLALDLGSGATVVVWADAEKSARVVLGHLGMGYGIGRVLSLRGAERIRRWLPFPISLEEVRNWVLNRTLRPRSLPTTVRDFLLSQAVAREALSYAMERLREQVAPSFEVIVATGGGLTRTPRLAQAALLLLDVLQPLGETPSGLVDLYLDRSQLLPSVGALATVNPDAAACVLTQDGLFHLGSCIVPLGRPRPGARAVEIELEFADEVKQTTEVAWGQLACVPFRWSEAAHLTIRPARGVRIGQGRPGEPLTTKGGEMIYSGALGLIVDARGRPLSLPEKDDRRIAQLRNWLEQCSAYTPAELDQVLPPPEVEAPTEEAVPGTEVAPVASPTAPSETERLPWE